MTHHDTVHPVRRRRLWAAVHGPAGAFARAAALGGLGVAAIGTALPGVPPQSVIAAVALYAAAAMVAGWQLRQHYPHDRIGLCNHVTLVRLVLVGILVAPTMAGSGPSWTVFALAALALSLDGADGWLARRQGLVSGFGARFDMEVDSALALVLAVNAGFGSEVGLAAILLGLPRYVFGAATLRVPWMRRALPDRRSRKVVCVLQLATLIALQAPILPPLLAALLAPLAALALIWSFAVDVLWLWRRRA